MYDDPDTQNLVRKEIFEHRDWVELDRGTLTLDQAVERGAARTTLPQKEILRILDAVPPSLSPIQATIDLIEELGKTRNRLFVLSNMQLASIAHLEQHHDIWGLFDGVVISSRIQMVKPEHQIYEYLLRRHQLEPAETVFIDDMPENLAAASIFGIQTIRFIDPAQCAHELANVRQA